MENRPPCPYLPEPEAQMSYRCLSTIRAEAGEAYYLTALRYGHYLWLNGHSGRAILALTRALYTDLPEHAEIYRKWPLPYQALLWIVENHEGDDFPGNPRISFQHQATRLRGERMELRRARAWAVWALVCLAKPELSADAGQGIQEPTLESIEAGLIRYGHRWEAALWKESLSSA